MLEVRAPVASQGVGDGIQNEREGLARPAGSEGSVAFECPEIAALEPSRYPAGAVKPPASLMTHSRNAVVIGSSAVASGPAR